MVTRAALIDFIFNPILVKETHRTSRSFRTFLPFYLMMVFLSFGLVLLMVFFPSAHDLRYAIVIPFIPVGLGILHVLGTACSSISDEHNRHTLDLLRITRLQPWEIVWGKLTATMVPGGIAIAASAPLAVICVQLGCIDTVPMLVAYLHLLLAVVCVATIGIALSALIKNTAFTTIAALILVLYGILTSVVPYVAYARAVGGNVLLKQLPLIGYSLSAFRYVIDATVFFLAAVALLSPPSANRSTALRICYVAVVFYYMVMHVVMRYIATPPQAPAGYFEYAIISYLYANVAIPSALAALLFCGESAQLSERLRKRYGQRPPAWKVFVPGRVTAALFVRVVTLSASAICLLFAAASGKASVFLLAATFAIAVFIHVHFCCTVATAARSFWDSPKSRIVAIVAVLAITLLYRSVFTTHHTTMLSLLRYPMALLCPTFEYPLQGRTSAFEPFPPAFTVFAAFYLIASMLVSIARRLWERHKARKATHVAAAAAGLAAQQT